MLSCQWRGLVYQGRRPGWGACCSTAAQGTPTGRGGSSHSRTWPTLPCHLPCPYDSSYRTPWHCSFTLPPITNFNATNVLSHWSFDNICEKSQNNNFVAQILRDRNLDWYWYKKNYVQNRTPVPEVASGSFLSQVLVDPVRDRRDMGGLRQFSKNRNSWSRGLLEIYFHKV